jgi:hypothetical protein
VFVGYVSPAAAAWVTANLDMIVFVYAFTWIFVLSSVIPSVLLGKERSVLVQYFVCLVLAFLAFSIQGFLVAYGGFQFQQLLAASVLLSNPIFAVFYLAVPYIMMIAIDVYARKQRKEKEEAETPDYFEYLKRDLDTPKTVEH